jgi:AcrR family transcriptional regulator
MPKILTDAERQRKRQDILDAAAGEIARLGYERANINAIAERAGIGRGTIYLYFQSKDEVLDALLDAVGGMIDDTVRQCLEQRAPWPQRISALAAAFAVLAAEHHDFFRVHVSALHGVNRAIGQPVARWLRVSVDRLALALAQAARRGEIQALDPQTLALLLLGMLESLALLPDVLGMDAEHAQLRARTLASLIWQGIAPEMDSIE